MAVSCSSLPHLGGKIQINSGSEQFPLCSLQMGTKDIMEVFVHRILNSISLFTATLKTSLRISTYQTWEKRFCRVWGFFFKSWENLYLSLHFSFANCFILSPLIQLSLSTLHKLFPCQIIAAFCFGSTLEIWMFSHHQLLFSLFFLLFIQTSVHCQIFSLFYLYLTHSANWPMLCLILFPLGSDFKRSQDFISLILYLRMESASFI